MSISQKYFSILSTLPVSMEEHDNRMDENNLRESIEFDISVSKGIQETTFDYNEAFWDSIQSVLN